VPGLRWPPPAPSATPAIGSLHLFSPFADLTFSGASVTANAATDPWNGRRAITVGAASYIHGQDPADPGISPALADLAGLPPIHVHVAEDEVFVDTAAMIVAAADHAQLHTVPDSVPSFILFGELEESDQALAAIAGAAAGGSASVT
jgi:monoterpene epsilon-lactone hydrolase